MSNKPLSADQTDSPFGPIVCDLYHIALEFGAALDHPKSLMSLNVEAHIKTDFQRGVLACVESVFYRLSQLPEGRKALCDLGLEPFFEYRECPRHGGRDD